MQLIRSLTAGMFVILAIYSAIVIANFGMNLLPIFVSNIVAVNWSGQFNLDFMFYLILSALWVAWRHRFSAIGIVLGLIASVAGILFFAPYVFIQAGKSETLSDLLLGEQKA